MESEFSVLNITLLKGVLYQEADPHLWGALLNLQARVRDYVAVLGLSLVVDEAEGYAFLRSRSEEADQPVLPRLITRRPLSFPVSFLLVQLRKKLAEFDAQGGSTRLILTRTEIVDMMRVYTPDSSNEARLADQIDTHLNKVVDLGFLRHLKNSESYEVRRILKAFVDAQWLQEFDSRLQAYQEHATA
ncbi:MAG TPA: DUF4194 domain-containing protein [Candidatus Xenobia bacterium]|jgi:hypothetical protein